MTPAAPIIVAISDATGETAEQSASAALAQFGYSDDSVRTFSNVRSEGDLSKALERARELGAMVVYTLVDKKLRGAIKDLAQVEGVTAVDLIGGLIRSLARHLDTSPMSVPGLSHELDDEYFRRVAAVEFSVNHDDGKNPQNLTKADIVIVGISRASKTPLSNYIAHRGFRVANVPIVMGVPLPKQLDDVDPDRVFVLTVDPVVLMKIRQARMASLRMRPDSDYGDIRQIRREINHAKRVASENGGWTMVDMSRKAVEEAATAIIETYRSRFNPDGSRRGRKGAAKKTARKKAKKAAKKRASRKRTPKKAVRKKAADTKPRRKAAKKKSKRTGR